MAAVVDVSWCCDGVETLAWQALGPFPPTERLLNVTAHLLIAADHVREVVGTVNPSEQGK